MNTAKLASRLGYVFRDRALAERALTHRSAGPCHYERLEFLGDGMLNFIIGQALYAACPDASEGDLTRLRASLVREETLAEIGAELGLGDTIIFGTGELRSGAYRRRSILADAVEALLGAILVDGGYEAAREVCLNLWADRLADLPDPRDLKDPKTLLQERLQGQARPRPEYEVLEISGPPHRQSFRVSCSLPDADDKVEAHGASRRGAEQQAARAMLAKMEEGGDA